MSGLNLGFRIEDGVLIDGDDRLPASIYEEVLWEERDRLVRLADENEQLADVLYDLWQMEYLECAAEPECGYCSACRAVEVIASVRPVQEQEE